jgi:hypothetical protein
MAKTWASVIKKEKEKYIDLYVEKQAVFSSFFLQIGLISGAYNNCRLMITYFYLCS